jgi:NADPH-dependent 2,4-dienoyl-CoA reductase/sulfur reductase-like enzyme
MARRTELAVVGAGPAGMAAAVVAAQAGARVTVVDEYSRPGGQYWKQLPRAFELADPGALGSQYARGHAFAARLGHPNIELLADTLVWGVAADGALLLQHGAEGERLAYDALVLATGAYDRPIAFPGWDLPGVITAGAAQTLVKSQRVLPGRNVLLVGSGPFLLRRHHVPIRTGQIVLRAEGRERVERVTVAAVDSDWRPCPGMEETYLVDTLAIGYGFLVSTELARLLGCAMRWDPYQEQELPIHDQEQQSTVTGVYVAGELTGVAGAEVALAEGYVAGLAAAARLGKLSAAQAQPRLEQARRRLAHLRRFASIVNELFRMRPGIYELADDATVICRCEEVTAGEIRRAVAYGARTANALKAWTRVGMGPCQGRVCGNLVTHLIADQAGLPLESVPGFTTRPPIKPVPIGLLAEPTEESVLHSAAS